MKARPLLRHPRRYDLGGTLNQIVPPLQMPYIAVTKAQPLDTLSVRQKLKDEADENLDKLTQEAEKLWTKTLEKTDILSGRRQEINAQKDAFFQDLREKVSSNPYFLANTSNRLGVLQGIQSLVSSPELQQYVDEKKQHNADWTRIQGDHKELDPYMRDGQFTGMTNQEYYAGLSSNQGQQFRRLVGWGASGPNDRGSYYGNGRRGTFDKAMKTVDDLANSVNASTVTRGGQRIVTDQGLQGLLGSSNPALVKLGSHVKGAGNMASLEQLATYLGQNVRSALSKDDQEGLEDHFSRTFLDSQKFQGEFTDVSGEKHAAGTINASTVYKALQLGQINEADQVRQQLEKQRLLHVEKGLSQLVVERVLKTGKGFSESENTSTVDVVDKGEASGKEQTLLDKMGFNLAVQQQFAGLDWQLQEAADADDPTRQRQFAFTVRPDSERDAVEKLRLKQSGVDEKGQPLFEAMSLADMQKRGFNIRLLNSGNPLFKNGRDVKQADKIKVTAYVSEGAEYGGDAATRRNFEQIKAKRAELESKPDMPEAQRQKILSDIEILKRSSSSKPVIRYRIEAPADVMRENAHIFGVNRLNALGQKAQETAQRQGKEFVPNPTLHYTREPLVSSRGLGFSNQNLEASEFDNSYDNSAWFGGDNVSTDILVDFPAGLTYSDAEHGKYFQFQAAAKAQEQATRAQQTANRAAR